MMPIRTFDRDLIAAAVASRDVAPENFDAAAWVGNPANVALVSGPDLALFEGAGDGLCWGHYAFQSRGKQAMQVARAMLDVIFAGGMRVVAGQTPTMFRAVRMFNRRLGFRSLGTVETPRGEVEVFMMSRDIAG